MYILWRIYCNLVKISSILWSFIQSTITVEKRMEFNNFSCVLPQKNCNESHFLTSNSKLARQFFKQFDFLYTLPIRNTHTIQPYVHSTDIYNLKVINNNKLCVVWKAIFGSFYCWKEMELTNRWYRSFHNKMACNFEHCNVMRVLLDSSSACESRFYFVCIFQAVLRVGLLRICP